MRKSYLYYKLGLFALLALTFYSCKKSNGINNDNVIETPYGVYVGDSSGTLYNTSDGSLFKIIFPADGYPQRALCVSSNNLLMVKSNLYFSTNNGVDFNPSYDSVSPTGLNQSLIFNSPDEGRIYLASTGGRMGIALSLENGALHTWVSDTLYDTANITGPVTVSSFAELTNNTIIAYDAQNNRTFSRTSATSKWEETTNSSHTLPAPASFTLGSYNNTVVAIDYSGQQGAWYSNDNGATWAQYSGLPNRPLLSVASPFNQVLLVGTDSAGIYRLNGSSTTFVASNNGLTSNMVVKGITAKQNLYKNGNVQSYVYIATNQGLYRSVDNGTNWILMFGGNFVAIY